MRQHSALALKLLAALWANPVALQAHLASRGLVEIKEPPRESDRTRSTPHSGTFGDHVRSVRKKLHTATDRLEKGHISVSAWADSFHDTLVAGHAEAWTLGRQRAGDSHVGTMDDHLVGRGKADAESEWLDNFREALENKDPRYFEEDGTLRADAVKARQDLYAQKLRGTANEAFVETSDETEEFDWVLGTAENCPDCPRIASLSPFEKDSLFAYPCSGDTACLGNCLCFLVRKSDGKHGFKSVNLGD